MMKLSTAKSVIPYSNPLDVALEIYILVLNWNGKDDTFACLDSLFDQSYPNIHIVVLDNGSSDGSVEAIRSAYPGVSIVENSTNLGFSIGNNIGMKYALDQGADYILLLNNDTIVRPTAVETLVNVIRQNTKVGAVGPKILYYENPEYIWSAGGVLKYHQHVAAMRGYRQRDQGQFQVREDVDFVPGSAMFVSGQAIKEIGYLDEIFSPLYFEDVDWCLRAGSAGYRVLYEPEAEVLHKVSVREEYSPMQRYLFSYSSILFMKRYANILQWIKFIFLGIFSLPFVLIVRSLQGGGKSVIAKGAGILDALIWGYRKRSFN